MCLHRSGVKGLGPSASEGISRAFGRLDAVMEASEADLATTEGVGPTIAASIVRWFAQPANRDGREVAARRGRLRQRRGEPAAPGARRQGRGGHRVARGVLT
ncbi:MAG: helix-hairpin-helix domain-containing protein [Ilumatobacteraceae bacterium]